MTQMYEDWGELDERWRGIRSERWVMRGASTHVLVADAFEGAADQPIQVLVHGLGGSANNWLDVIGGLRRHGPVVAPDLPGFGLTEPPGPGGGKLRTSLIALARLTMSLESRPVVLHGNSMGGMLAVLLASKRPDLVERLVLVDPALPSPRTALLQLSSRTLLMFAPFVVPRLGRPVVTKVHSSYTADQLFEANQQLIHTAPERISPALQAVARDNIAYAQQTPWRLTSLADAGESVVSAILGRRWLWKAVDEVQCPTLVVWGDGDELVGGRAIDAALARQPDWDLTVLQNVGHCPMMEAPHEYLGAVNAWHAPAGASTPVPGAGDPARADVSDQPSAGLEAKTA